VENRPIDNGFGLSNVELKLVTAAGASGLRHTWLHQAESADKWNWSLLTVPGGRWPDRSAVRLERRGAQGRAVLDVPGVQFADREVLRRVIAEASRASLPDDHQCSLESVLQRAGESPPPQL